MGEAGRQKVEHSTPSMPRADVGGCDGCTNLAKGVKFMCGFAGFLNDRAGANSLEAIATRMALAIQHRGPDDAGAWADEQAGIALGHRRLSIVDLSPAGHQPMAFGRWALCHRLQWRDLQPSGFARRIEAAGAAPAWRGHSDTETLLAAFEHWGVETTLQNDGGHVRHCAVGCARAHPAPGARPLWRKAAVLRLGEWRFCLWFGTEGAARLPWLCQPGEPRGAGACTCVLPMCRRRTASIRGFTSSNRAVCSVSAVNPQKLADFQPLRPPATGQGITLRRWWSLAEVVEAGAKNPILDEQEALTALEARLGDAVRLQSLADVPLGAFLSGGVDSSAIVALMQRRRRSR